MSPLRLSYWVMINHRIYRGLKNLNQSYPGIPVGMRGEEVVVVCPVTMSAVNKKGTMAEMEYENFMVTMIMCR